jgi:hypothetical protein
MANALKDGNGVNSMTAVLNTNGTTIVRIKVDGTTHALKVDDGATGSDNGPTRALRDENSVPTLLAVSNVDGVTIVPLYADSSGNLLIQST